LSWLASSKCATTATTTTWVVKEDTTFAERV
jgi:hypothetical protein